MRITVWNEYLHEQNNDAVAAVYPQGIHHTLAQLLQTRLQSTFDELSVATATLDEPEHGLPGVVLDETDVLLWWGHLAHHMVADEVVEQVLRTGHARHGSDCSTFSASVENFLSS